MVDWCAAMERGKVRGYEEYKLFLGECYIYQYAISHLESKGAVIDQFTAIKGVLPF